MKTNNFAFILTEKCNWNCEYCAFPLVKNPKHTTIEILSKHLPYINEILYKSRFSSVDGGELGLLDRETLRFFFEFLSFPMIVSTNGTFLDNMYHIEFAEYIIEIWHHIDIYHPINKCKGLGNIKRGIVHNNFFELIKFIEENPDIEFDYVELETDIRNPKQVDYGIYQVFFKKIKPLENVTQKAKDIIQGRLVEKQNWRTFCMKYNDTVVFDLVNERIPICHRAWNNSIPLTRRNLQKRLNNFPYKIYSEESDSCNSCTRLFANKFSLRNIL